MHSLYRSMQYRSDMLLIIWFSHTKAAASLMFCKEGRCWCQILKKLFCLNSGLAQLSHVQKPKQKHFYAWQHQFWVTDVKENPTAQAKTCRLACRRLGVKMSFSGMFKFGDWLEVTFTNLQLAPNISSCNYSLQQLFKSCKRTEEKCFTRCQKIKHSLDSAIVQFFVITISTLQPACLTYI